MTPRYQRSISLAALISVIATTMPATQALADTTRFDALANAPFSENRPTRATEARLADELLFQRATQTYPGQRVQVNGRRDFVTLGCLV